MNERMNECKERKEKTELGRMLHSIKLTQSLKFFAFSYSKLRNKYTNMHIYIYTHVCVCVYLYIPPFLPLTHIHRQHIWPPTLGISVSLITAYSAGYTEALLIPALA